MDAANMLIDGWQGNKFAGLYLYGTPGTGKTHAAIGLGRALHETGADIFYRYVPEISDYRNPEYWRGSRHSNVKYEGNGVFPNNFHPGAQRNPKTVLILDDYRPEAQIPLHQAVDAAAQFGGLVVITSNYTDPFKLIEVAEVSKDEDDIIKQALLEQLVPETATEIKNRRMQAAETISSSLRSRIAAGFKLIEFSGEDRRQQNSFWQ